MTRQKTPKQELTELIETALSVAKDPDRFRVCLLGNNYLPLLKYINLLDVNDRLIKLLPGDSPVFSYLQDDKGNRIEF